MRRILILLITLLLTIPLLLVRPAQMQEPRKPLPEQPLPNTADFPQAGASCKRRHNVAPWVGTPGVDWPNTFQCVLKYHTCDGVKTSVSPVRSAGTGMCADFWKVHNELARREICCDGSSAEKRAKPPEKCEKPTSWFSPSSSGCKDVQSPQITQAQGMVTLSLCGYPIWSTKSVWGATGKPDIEGANEAKAALAERVRSQVGSRICCDNFREAVRTGVPCDPRADLDCDGKPNREDTAYPQRYVSPRDNDTYSYSGSLPDINIFSKADGAAIDPFPQGLNPDDPNFIPPADKCECKWELVKGTLTCSPDGKQSHVYQARWRCPSSGNETFTRKEAPGTAPCK